MDFSVVGNTGEFGSPIVSPSLAGPTFLGWIANESNEILR